MRIIGIVAAGILLAAAAHAAQAQDAAQPIGTMSDVMVSMVYPPTNDLLLAINRGAPRDDREWTAVQRSAVRLAESGNTLMMRGRARDQGDWIKYSRMLVDAGAAAYKAARSKDAAALAAVEAPLNASCTACHKQYRPNVHPRTSTN